MRIYLCPALFDWLVFLVHFAVFYAAGQREMPIGQQALVGCIFQLTYLVFSLSVGYLLNRDKARRWLIASVVVGLGLSIACILQTQLTGMLIAMALFGCATAVFFNAFQTFMRGEAEPGGLMRSVGMYTLSWSMGSGFGFLSSGAAFDIGQGAVIAVCVVVGLVILAILVPYRARPSHVASADEHVEQGSVQARRVNPRYVWVGWVIIFTAMFVQRPFQNFLPEIYARQGVSSFAASMPLFLMMAVQALVGMALARHRDLLYRRTPLWTVQLAIAALFVVMWQWPSYWVCLVGIGLMGVGTGFCFVSAVYYASNSGRRSFNIGVNECLVGVGSLLSLFAGKYAMELMADRVGALCAMAAGAMVLSTALQMFLASLPAPADDTAALAESAAVQEPAARPSSAA